MLYSLGRTATLAVMRCRARTPGRDIMARARSRLALHKDELARPSRARLVRREWETGAARKWGRPRTFLRIFSGLLRQNLSASISAKKPIANSVWDARAP